MTERRVRGRATPKSLRRRLFGSHLLVMAVAIGVLVVGFGLAFTVLELTDGRGKGANPQRSESSGPIGLLIALGAATTASALVSWRVARRLGQPVDDIRAATRRLADGDYGARVSGADTEELDALADDVNRLALELETTEQRRLRLIGDVAHELRNPLSTIEGTMEALLDEVVEADDDTFARIGREAARLRRLADDLSTLSAAGERRPIEGAPVDVGALATDVVAQLEPQATAKNIDLRVVAPSGAPISADRDQLTQVLTNVIGNAVQYTDRGTITVEVTSSATTGASVTVSDTGRGLLPEDQTRIFERFHRVDGHLSDGTGVGLAIARLIVDAHGGRISATSDGLGTGSTISISLPATR